MATQTGATHRQAGPWIKSRAGFDPASRTYSIYWITAPATDYNPRSAGMTKKRKIDFLRNQQYSTAQKFFGIAIPWLIL